MRKFLSIVLLAATLVGCESETASGPCVGIADDKNPNLVYRTSVRNVILAIVFVEMLFPPIVVLASETSCPVGPRSPQPSVK